MRGFPVIFVIFVVGSIVVRILKAIAEAQQQASNQEQTGGNDEQWTEWTPQTPPPPPVAKAAPPPLPPSVPRSIPHQPTAPVARTTVRELLRELQQAGNQPPSPAQPVARRASRPKPPPIDLAKEESPAYVRLSDAFAADDQPKPKPKPTASAPPLEPTLSLAFPKTDGTPDTSPSRPQTGFRLHGRDDLRRAFIVREILDRPRAFDL